MGSYGALLAEIAFFKGMHQRHIDAIAACASAVQFKPGEYLFREGQESRDFHVIERGRVALEIRLPGRGPITLETLGDGELLGWSWLIPPYKKAFDARAVEATRAIVFDAAVVRGKCDQDAGLGYDLLQRFCQVIGQRLQATRLQLLDVYGTPAAKAHA
ncbi:MAG: cyclic nucleotide-binding domain-containing protein [Verrucomicrobia bacterium]|nr:cyclic nucleotide-binding domain-containing protein [Verrucomicrobiota bacterium]